MSTDRQACKVCGGLALDEVEEFRSVPRVTSDCVPFRNGGRLLICDSCGAAQSPADEQWLDEIEEVYKNYRAYHHSGGVEQQVLDSANDQLRPRSEVLVDHLMATPNTPNSGRLLDVGCGTGGTLCAFSKRKGWRLFGLEMDTKALSFLEQIDGFEALYTSSAADLPGSFDMVTMVHSLEHFPEPLEILRDLRAKIAPGGRLFVEVPNVTANPFDYLIADHMMHFTASSLSILMDRAGFKVDHLSTAWVNKELSILAEPSITNNGRPEDRAPEEAAANVRRQVNWLQRFVDVSRQVSAASSTFGLFGTSIAATWLCSVLAGAVSFFVEEDPNRVGRSYMGRPVISPAQVGAGTSVFLALVPQIAVRVAARLKHTGIDLHLPPV